MGETLIEVTVQLAALSYEVPPSCWADFDFVGAPEKAKVQSVSEG